MAVHSGGRGPGHLARNQGGDPPITLLLFGDSITNSYTYYSDPLKSLIETRQASAVNMTRVGAGGLSFEYAYGGNPKLNTYIANNTSLVNAAAKIVIFAGTNGLQLGGHTPTEEYEDFEIGLGLLLAAGATPANITVVTMLPRENYSEVNRASFNALLVGGAVTYGYNVAKIHLNTDIGVAGQQNETWFDGDHIHPTAAAGDQIARIIYDQFYSDFYSTFDGSQIPGYWDHWDAQVSGSITQAAGRVSAWASQGSGRVLAQATGGNQPAYAATGINSLPAIDFDGGSRRAWLDNAAISFDTKPMSYWLAIKWDDYTTDITTPWYMGTNNTSWESGVRLTAETTGLIRFNDAINGGSATYASAASTTAMIITGARRTAAGFTPTSPIFKSGLNGATGSPSATQLTATALRVGCPALDIWRMRGKIGEIGFAQGDTPAYWHQLLAKKLAAKWGVAAPDVP